jgi:hypothetical protein
MKNRLQKEKNELNSIHKKIVDELSTKLSTNESN